MVRPSFDALYREHYPRVLGFCRRLLGSADAEDAAQDTFVRGYRAFDRYRPEQPFGPWIGAIASHHCIDLLRRRKRLSEVFSDDDGAAAEALPDPAGNGAAPLIEASDAAALAAAVDRLPERYRLPILLAYYADSSYDDIAATLGITRNHVGVLLLRGRERLRHELAGTARPDETTG